MYLGTLFPKRQVCRLQRLNKDKNQAHRTYAFRSTVLASGSQADSRRMVGKFAYGAYLGPVLNKTSHWTTIQLDGPESQVKIVQSSAVKCVLTFSCLEVWVST